MILHDPVPTTGVFPARVVLVPQIFWLTPAVAGVGVALEDVEEPPRPELVHRTATRPGADAGREPLDGRRDQVGAREIEREPHGLRQAAQRKSSATLRRTRRGVASGGSSLW